MDLNSHNSQPRSEIFILKLISGSKEPANSRQNSIKTTKLHWSEALLGVPSPHFSPGLFENGLKLVTDSTECVPGLDHNI